MRCARLVGPQNWPLWFFFFQAEDGIRDLIVTGGSEEHTSELQSRSDLVCRLLLVTGGQTCALPILQSRSDLGCRLLLEKKNHGGEQHAARWPCARGV